MGACAPGATLGGAEMTIENKMTQRKKKLIFLVDFCKKKKKKKKERKN